MGQLSYIFLVLDCLLASINNQSALSLK